MPLLGKATIYLFFNRLCLKSEMLAAMQSAVRRNSRSLEEQSHNDAFKERYHVEYQEKRGGHCSLL
jgi:hypothetical protein